MKAYLSLILGALLSLTLLSACGPPLIYKQPVFPVCEGRYRANLGPISSLYSAATNPSCKQYIQPKDVSAWLESPLNSHRLRGINTIVLGCANLTTAAESCEYGGPESHSTTLGMVFDFTRYNERSRVRKAVLAIHANTNAGFLSGAASLRGRLMVGDNYQSLAISRKPPTGQSGWILFDITDIAARAIADRRDSVDFELSLPCSRNDRDLSVVGVLRPEPVVLVEYL
ncbi:MAG: hypothetical protein LBR11_03885 [Deltaproteobacteria bacterium]|jgi:hypothetical protein|nr:hypothetical protein [Deltaproteobacteria bacterium]